jgi:hypothetical protein
MGGGNCRERFDIRVNCFRCNSIKPSLLGRDIIAGLIETGGLNSNWGAGAFGKIRISGCGSGGDNSIW